MLLNLRVPGMVLDLAWNPLKIEVNALYSAISKHGAHPRRYSTPSDADGVLVAHLAYFFMQMDPPTGPLDIDSAQKLVMHMEGKLIPELTHAKAQLPLLHLLRYVGHLARVTS
jgi:hypothetical protein